MTLQNKRFDQFYGRNNQQPQKKSEPIQIQIQKSETDVNDSRRKIQFERDQAHKSGRTACPHCDFTGMMNAIEIETKVMYAFRCTSCKAADGLNLGPAFPGWSADLLNRFKPLRSNEVQEAWNESLASNPPQEPPKNEQNPISDLSEMPF